MKKLATEKRLNRSKKAAETDKKPEWDYHRDFKGLVKILKKRKLTRDEQILEADAIYEWLVGQRALVGDLIHTTVKVISDKEEAADARLALHILARELAASTGPRADKAVWEDYQHHFIGDQNSKEFFVKLRRCTRRVCSELLASKENNDPAPAWDSSLLPKSIALYVTRLAILHPCLLESFLPRLFVRASDFLWQKSTYRRALLILQAVPLLGWSAEKHTENLIHSGSIQTSEDASEVETVKKFIRDLRLRYRKHLKVVIAELKRIGVPPRRRKGTLKHKK